MMKGLERLRRLAEDIYQSASLYAVLRDESREEWGAEPGGRTIADALREIADEIDREAEGRRVYIGDDTSGRMPSFLYAERIKRPAVLAADGEPLEVGQKVYGTGPSQHTFRVIDTNDVNTEAGDRFIVKCFDVDEGEECWCEPNLLTHTEPDSWKKVYEDLMKWPGSGIDFDDLTRDLVRR